MSFCPECGANVENEFFCHKCGKRIMNECTDVEKQPNISGYNDARIQRTHTISELANLYNYFYQKINVYTEYENIVKKINFASVKDNSLVVVCILLFVFGGVGVLGLFMNSMLEGIICGIVLGAILFFLIHSIRKQEKNRLKRLAEYNSKLAELDNELVQHYREYGYCPVGMNYCHPRVIEKMAYLVESGRADSIKEAIEKMLDDAHKSAMEHQAVLTTQAAQVAARNSAAAATNSGISAACSLASLLLR